MLAEDITRTNTGRDSGRWNKKKMRPITMKEDVPPGGSDQCDHLCLLSRSSSLPPRHLVYLWIDRLVWSSRWSPVAEVKRTAQCILSSEQQRRLKRTETRRDFFGQLINNLSVFLLLVHATINLFVWSTIRISISHLQWWSLMVVLVGSFMAIVDNKSHGTSRFKRSIMEISDISVGQTE